MKPPSIVDAVHDLLETYDGSWYTMQNICDWFSDVKPTTVRRSVARLVERGVLKQRDSTVHWGDQVRVKYRSYLYPGDERPPGERPLRGGARTAAQVLVGR